MKAPVLLMVAAGLMAGSLTASAAVSPRESRIPFVQYGGIRDWRTASDDELFIQDSGRRWYHVALMGPCTGLSFASGVRFLPSDSAGTFDRFSWIAANGERCKVQSVERIPGEPDVPNPPRPRARGANY